MKPQSCKAKGRRFQQQVCADLLRTFPELQEDDVRSTSMGCNGEDCQLSPAAREKIPCSIECKNVERLNIWSTIDQCLSNAGSHHPLIVIKKNKTSPWAAVPWEFFLQLLRHRYDATRTDVTEVANVRSTRGDATVSQDDASLPRPAPKRALESTDDATEKWKRIRYHVAQLADLTSSSQL